MHWDKGTAAGTWAVNSREQNFLVGHSSWVCFRANSLNFEVLMEPEASNLSKGIVLGGDENIHIKLTGFTPLGEVGGYIFIHYIYFTSSN
ncbi:hypothetical protein DVH24_015708 [Malus domestica]|uniref:Uncharacterized protein n=1 Tax=Malus domestica TaxID=3750 RepID=A0A498HHY4_MALDO|nr:hypothetical protein DVH24_015708 [Malus domestica]